MNHDLPPFDDAAREREWQAQERALQAERHGGDPAADDARTRRYRLLARALREPLPDALPADFARRMATLAAATPTRGAAATARNEWVPTLGLVAVLAIAASIALAVYSPAWLPAFSQLPPIHSVPGAGWLLTLGGCLGASWLLGLWHDHRRPQAARPHHQ